MSWNMQGRSTKFTLQIDALGFGMFGDNIPALAEPRLSPRSGSQPLSARAWAARLCPALGGLFPERRGWRGVTVSELQFETFTAQSILIHY